MKDALKRAEWKEKKERRAEQSNGGERTGFKEGRKEDGKEYERRKISKKRIKVKKEKWMKNKKEEIK